MPLVSLRKLAPWREVINYNCHEFASIIMALTVQFSKINWYRSNIKLNQSNEETGHVCACHKAWYLHFKWLYKLDIWQASSAVQCCQQNRTFWQCVWNTEHQFFLFSKTCNNYPMVRRCYTGLETIPINTIKRYNYIYCYFVVTFNLQSPWLSLCHMTRSTARSCYDTTNFLRQTSNIISTAIGNKLLINQM